MTAARAEGASGSTPPVVSVKGLRKRFDAAGPVLDGIDLAVAPGSLVALIGANGAGKSTLLRCIMRLIEAEAGEIRLFGEDVRALRPRELRRMRSRVGFVFQKHNLVGRLCALSNVVHGAQARGHGPRAWHQALAPAALRREAMVCLERVGLADHAGKRADQLSGGQSQRVAIARALMQRPELVLADEPAASLDPQAGDEVMGLFLNLMRDERLTVVFSSHNLDHAVAYADRIVGLNNGRVAIDAPAAGNGAGELRRLYG